METCCAYSQSPTPPACGQTGTPNLAARSTTASTSFMPPRRQQSSWQTSIASSWSSCLKTTRFCTCSPVATRTGATASRIRRWPRMSSGLVGSSIHHGSTSESRRMASIACSTPQAWFASSERRGVGGRGGGGGEGAGGGGGAGGVGVGEGGRGGPAEGGDERLHRGADDGRGEGLGGSDAHLRPAADREGETVPRQASGIVRLERDIRRGIVRIVVHRVGAGAAPRGRKTDVVRDGPHDRGHRRVFLPERS